jgi:hypothetical protein
MENVDQRVRDARSGASAAETRAPAGPAGAGPYRASASAAWAAANLAIGTLNGLQLT